MPSISGFLTHVLIHQRKIRTPNGAGGFTEEYELYADGVTRGRINPAGSRELEIAHQQHAEVTHLIYLKSPSDILINDRILFGARMFRVTIPNADTPSVPIYQKCFVVEIQNGR